MKQSKIFYFFLLAMLFGFAGSISATTYRLQRVTSVEANQKYVFEQAGYVMKHTISSKALQTTNSYKTTGLDLTNNDDKAYVWELSSTSGGFKIYKYNATGDKYLVNSSSTEMSWGSSSSASTWSFSFQSDGTAFISTGSGLSQRRLAIESSAFSKTSYKCYDRGYWANQPHAIVVYKLVAEEKLSPALGFNNKFFKYLKGNGLSIPSLSKANGIEGTVVYSSTNSKVATVDYSTGEVSIVGAGHALITASISESASYDAGEATYTIVVMDGEGTASKPYSVADFFSGFVGYTSMYVQGYIVGCAYSQNNVYSFNMEDASTDEYVAIADERDVVSTSNTIPIRLSTTELQNIYGLMTHPEMRGTRHVFSGNIGALLNSQGITATTVSISTSHPVTISSYKYATYRTTEKLDFTGTGVSAYTAAIDGSNVKLTKISDGVVNTGLGVVLYSETAGTYDIPVTTVDASVTSTGLSISDGTSATKANMTYVLGKKNDVVGFYRWVGSASLPAGRVYLNGYSGGTARDYLEFMFDDDSTTGVDGVVKREEIKDKSYYDLQGRRVAHGQQPVAKGLYVVNGKKVVVK